MNEALPAHADLLALTADIVSAHVGNNTVAIGDLPTLIAGTFTALEKLGGAMPEPEAAREPAVPVKSSVKADHIVCLEDGKKLKMLKRHLMTRYNMTPEAYRRKWGLPADYPMVAPDYASERRSLALKIGLGTARNAGKGAAAGK